ncbi:hypothetical protein [Streptomyces hainanensis]|uniref:Formate-dependent nitrite reductase complex subunit NrfF n=1 Tax=Streptomyces hainanensis TaxID=402648 RepID=A0A4V6PBF8_9ACTN|nr:hypothetical protein [Streptomyces hainanensis]TDC62805.1 hypothetical protein E1283_33455 [Streptomyces hainanensis]
MQAAFESVTVVRCAEGHVFSTSRFPLQQLGSERIGPGRLLRCPRCARLRSAVPVGASGPGPVEVQV